jgi:hypothetical protein
MSAAGRCVWRTALGNQDRAVAELNLRAAGFDLRSDLEAKRF